MTEERSPERRRPSAGRGGPRKKARRVSQRKELAVVTLGMVAAISGVGGLLAANPPSWATTTEPVHATGPETTVQQQAARPADHKEQAMRGVEQGAVRRAPQKAAEPKEAAREDAARAKTARKQSKQAARQQQHAVYSAQPQASASASASARASVVSQGS